MILVITNSFTMTCPHCHNRLAFEKNDIFDNIYVTCPVCDSDNYLEWNY